MQTKQTDLARLLIGTKVFVVPQFQRQYKWKRPEWQDLFSDLKDQYLGSDVQSGLLQPDEGHFMGSVVLHPAPGPKSTVSKYWVIDGQQRLTTLLVLIAAVRDVRSARQPEWDPGEYENQYLRNRYSETSPYRMESGSTDRASFESTVYLGEPKGAIGEAYVYFSRAIEELAESDDFDFKKLEQAILLRLLIVEISTSHDDNINQIFHTINHAGMKLSGIDLIRNHAFMQFDHAIAGELHEILWRPMESAFDDEAVMSEYLWAQLVRRDKSATKRDLFTPFSKTLTTISRTRGGSLAQAASELLTKLRDEVSLFKVIQDPTNESNQRWGRDLHKVLDGLSIWGSQTYVPIALELLSRLSDGQISEKDATSSLSAVLSFLVRRGVCGIPTNNLNRILSALPSDISGDEPAHAQVTQRLLAARDYWPNDAEVNERAIVTPLFHTLRKWQLEYVLYELNAKLGAGEPLAVEELNITRVLPSDISPSWQALFEKNGIELEVAKSRADLLGNLTLLPSTADTSETPKGKLNVLAASTLSLNAPFAGRSSWLPSDVDDRGRILASLVCEIWERPTSLAANTADETSDLVPTKFDLETVISLLPADAWTRVGALASLTRITPNEVIDKAESFGYPVINPGDNGPLDEYLIIMQIMNARESRDLVSSGLSEKDYYDIASIVSAVESVGADNGASVE